MKKVIAGALISLAATSSAYAVPVQWAVNGHWYEYFAGPVTAPDALTQAQAMTFSGMQGYLATVTSAEENTFVSVNVAQNQLAWLGGSDAGFAVNDWHWINGPEAGQAFTYTNWNIGEPNDCCGGENFLQTNFAVTEGWNDHGGPGNAGQANGYIVEFSPTAVPEPSSLALLGAGLFLSGMGRRFGIKKANA
jgi:Lectin C-type domain/PEP-CTERM motif